MIQRNDISYKSMRYKVLVLHPQRPAGAAIILETLAQNGTEAAASSWKFVGKKGRGTDSVPRPDNDSRGH